MSANSEAPKISVVVPARDAADSLGACLTALREQTLPPSEIVVVDDGSSDDTASIARAAGAEVIRQASRQGPGPARIAGAQATDGDILVFTDADCVAAPEFLERLVAPLENGAAAAKGVYTTDQGGLVPRFVQLEFVERYQRLAASPAPDFVDGHAVAYRRDVFEGLGGFDPNLRLSQNVELGYRLSEQGAEIAFVPEAMTRHRHPETVVGYAKAKFERAYWRTLSYPRHPRKLVADSYTPPVLKLQVILLADIVSLAAVSWAAGWLGAGSQTAAFVALAAGAAAALSAIAFVFSTLPFVGLAWRLDRPVAVIAIPMLLVRATALATGVAAGLGTLVVTGGRGR